MACAGGADGRARSGGTVVVERVYETPYNAQRQHVDHLADRRVEKARIGGMR